MPSGTTAKQMYRPAARSSWVHWMNRSNPTTVVGGGEMKRETSGAVTIASKRRRVRTPQLSKLHPSADQHRQPPVSSRVPTLGRG